MDNGAKNRGGRDSRSKTVLMLLTNAYDPDPRVHQEALALLRMGWRVRLLAWDRDLKSARFESMEGVEVDRVFVASSHGRGFTQLFFYALVYLKMIWRGLRTRCDVIHCHDLDTLPAGFLLARLKRKKVVYDAHESFPDMLEGSAPVTLRKGLVALENILIRRIDLLITVGEKLRRHFEARGARHSVVVGNWKRAEEFSRTAEENLSVRRRLGIPDAALVVVCITQLLKDRKLEELLAAIDREPNVYAIVGGKGSLEPLVRDAAAQNPRIVYVEFVSGREIADYTCTADIVYYGFDPNNPNARYSAPNKLYEALAAGRPLITGDFGEIAEVVRAARCGFVLPSYSIEAVRDALTQFQAPGCKETLSQNAARYGRNGMTWDRGEEILSREYSALLPSFCGDAGLQ